jgi:hypothetical protein
MATANRYGMVLALDAGTGQVMEAVYIERQPVCLADDKRINEKPLRL